jgi:hypothetical protein
VSRPPDRLDLALTKRLRAIVSGEPATESELRGLADEAGGWERAVAAQLHAAEDRLGRLNADPASPLADMAAEIRRVETLKRELDEARSLLAGLEERTRELRTAYLKRHAEATPPLRPPLP